MHLPALDSYNFVCSKCYTIYDGHQLHTFSPCCTKPLMAIMGEAARISRQDILVNENSMWRYGKRLPVRNPKNRVSLGEGFTPVLWLDTLEKQLNFGELWLKDEGQNPTGSFKARGLSMAVSAARERGVKACIIPTAGNAGGALAAYCAKAGMEAVVAMPKHTPAVFRQECEFHGAKVILVEGLINDCAAVVRDMNRDNAFFDVSTLKEPYRLEGKKTLGYEIAEQWNWQLPDVIVYPTGGGTGLIGIWKAILEMKQIGWLPEDVPMPRMVAVQAERCQPIVQVWEKRIPNASQYNGNPSIANGLAVPRPFGEDLIIEVLQESKGTAIAITESDMLDGVRQIARHEGLFVAPEGGALLPAAVHLKATGWIHDHESVLLLNTGTAYKYIDNLG